MSSPTTSVWDRDYHEVIYVGEHPDGVQMVLPDGSVFVTGIEQAKKLRLALQRIERAAQPPGESS